MAETILVTGGAGYVGSHVTRELLEQGHRVRVLDSFLYGDAGLKDVLEHPNLEIIVGDICEVSCLRSAVKGVSRVIALAALVGDAACDLDPRKSVVVNYESTRELADACRDAGVSRLVFASSCSVYGANGIELLQEDSHLNPVSLYARTRVMSEELLRRYVNDLDVVVLRLATVCGASPRMRFDLMVNTMTAWASTRGKIRVSGAEQWRPHLHVRDAASAFVRASEAPVESGRIYNVGTEELNYTIGEVADRVAALIPGVQVERVHANGDRRSYRVSFERIRQELQFVPRYTIDDAIGEVRELLASGAVQDFTSERFHNVKQLSTVVNRGAA